LGGERHRVGGVAGKHFDRHRTAVNRAQQAIDDLQLALLAVTRIAKARQLAAAAFQP
jgi:hypothetical protein